jgi:hypothetical protein
LASEEIPHLVIFVLVVRETPIYLKSVIIHSENGGKGEGCLVEVYSVALLCK